MPDITNTNEFRQALESLSLDQQRVLGAQFVGEVLDLTDDERIKHAQAVAAREDATPEELMNAYQSAKHVTVELSLHGDWEMVDWSKQAAYFVAKACAACLAPVHSGMKARHLAWNAAHYCRMARTCASVEHEAEHPSLEESEKQLNEAIRSQYELASTFTQTI